MSSVLLYVLIAVMLTVLIAVMIYMRKSKKFKNLQQGFKDTVKKLEETQQHEKYARIMNIRTYIIVASYILFVLSAIFLIVLPICKMQSPDDIKSENFSLYDTLTALKNEETTSTHFTDANKTIFYFITLIFTVVMILLIASRIYLHLKKMNLKGRAEHYASLKMKFFNPAIDPLLLYFCLLIAPIFSMIELKKAEHKVISDMPYTVTEIGRYLIYDVYDSDITLRVYQNNFKFYTGVSGYISVPIIFFVLGVALIALSIFLDHKLKLNISEEDVTIENQKDT